ncbi:MAG: MBOAT family O-acyltransferase [Bacteroidota bacterium]
MLFNSFHFILFFILITSIYYIIPHKFRWSLLLSASCYFYMVFVPIYILILGFTIVIDYYAGILLENSEGKKRKYFLVASLIANIGVLAVFKYYNFLNENITALLHGVNWRNPIPYLSIMLPIGLSFHTFQAMSYTIEVYRGNQKAERHFGIYSLYVMFFPQLVAGPIERPQNLIHQFYKKLQFNYEKVTSGLKLIGWGFFKKVVIADRLAVFVNGVYSDIPSASGLSALIAILFFSFQLYLDFSAYSDIAIGSARVLGIELRLNFMRPYLSTSFSDFWKRWHISLSSWFKEYLYIPLGGNKKGFKKKIIFLLIVFAISGLWHGASWNFVIWGVLNGLFIIIGDKLIFSKSNTLAKKAINSLIIFLLWTFSLIFFRAITFSDAILMFKNIGFSNPELIYNYGLNKAEFSLSLFLIASFIILEIFQEKKRILPIINAANIYIRWSLYILLALSIIILGSYGGINDNSFIYFQF